MVMSTPTPRSDAAAATERAELGEVEREIARVAYTAKCLDVDLYGSDVPDPQSERLHCASGATHPITESPRPCHLSKGRRDARREQRPERRRSPFGLASGFKLGDGPTSRSPACGELVQQDRFADAPKPSKDQRGSGPPALRLLEKHLEFADLQISTGKLGRPKAGARTIGVTGRIHVYILIRSYRLDTYYLTLIARPQVF